MARRLLLAYLTITALALAAVIVPLGSIFADHERDQLTFDIERDSQAVASMVEDALETGSAPSLDAMLSDYRSKGGRIVVVNDRGISVADSDEPEGPPRDFSTRPEIATALGGARSSGTRASETLRSNLVYVAVPVASGGVVHGAVRITYPTSALDARVRSAWLRLGLMSLVVLGIVAAVGMAFARGVTRPVRRLELASRELAAGDLSTRVDIDAGPPELRALAATFNTTAEQLDHLLESQRRFVADASHQLRTPLTALRLRLETLAPHVDPTVRPKLDAAIAETNRLARLVQSLLVLARSDASTTPSVSVDLFGAIQRRVDAWGPVANEQGVDLRSNCPPGSWVYAVPGAVEQILDNLVSNALEVAPDGTSVAIRAGARADGTTEVHVIDEGPGMTPEDRARAFERFWRPAQEHDRNGEGFGLGLAIVDQLARRSGGHARLDPGPDARGLDAVVTLPTSAAPREKAHEPSSSVGANLYPTLTSD